MRITLIESGGFVGVPLQYEVDLSALDKKILTDLERITTSETSRLQPEPNSAGNIKIRLETDDGSVKELTMSYASPDPKITKLLQQLRACARIMHPK
jgi:hypothetical protein